MTAFMCASPEHEIVLVYMYVATIAIISLYWKKKSLTHYSN